MCLHAFRSGRDSLVTSGILSACDGVREGQECGSRPTRHKVPCAGSGPCLRSPWGKHSLLGKPHSPCHASLRPSSCALLGRGPCSWLEAFAPLLEAAHATDLLYLQIEQGSFRTASFVLVFWLVLVVLECVRPRFWCRYLCPAGARLAPFRIGRGAHVRDAGSVPLPARQALRLRVCPAIVPWLASV